MNTKTFAEKEIVDSKENRNQYFPQSYPHPNETLIEKMQEMGVDAKQLSVLAECDEEDIISFLKGNRSITFEFADHLERATQIPRHWWVNHQNLYDSFQRKE